MRALLVAVFLLGLLGCATPDPSIEVGTPPADYEQRVKSYFENVLIDPDSAHYKIGTPYRAYLDAPLIRGGGIEWNGWAVDVLINAKNRMGGYSGWTPYYVLLGKGGVYNAFESTNGYVLFHRL
jgi:hypothetical protein